MTSKQHDDHELEIMWKKSILNPCHNGMAKSQAADGLDGLQIRKVTA
jgi:hypothetical protein